MSGWDTARFTAGVFQDVLWAERGVAALARAAIAPTALSILALDAPEVRAFVESVCGAPGHVVETLELGQLRTTGALVGTLQGAKGDLSRLGLARTLPRAGFQSHDGRIFETLISRGGVLVAVDDVARAADALTIFHSYGGGNAAIGARSGRI